MNRWLNLAGQRAWKMALLQRIKPSFTRDEPDRGSAPSPEMQSAGVALQEQRASFGLDLDEVAQALKIKPAYLAAIEEGRIDRLPGTVYAVGFIRAYSALLGLDSAEILRRFKLEASGFDTKPDLAFPMPLAERSMPGGGALITALILAICGYGAWYYWSTAEHTRPERVIEVPAVLMPPPKAAHSPTAPQPVSASAAVGHSLSALSETPAKPKADASAAGPSATAPAAGDSGLPAAPSSAAPPAISPERTAAASPAAASEPSGNAVASASPADPSAVRPAVPSPTEALAVPPPEAQSGHVYGPTDGPSRITLRANADSWVQIRAADRAVLFTGLLKPGDSYRVPDQPGLTMRAGNAGGLDVVVDGKPAASLGPVGAVRNVALDPQSLAARTAAAN